MSGIILEPTDRSSPYVSLGLGLQLTAVGLVATITLTTVVFRAAGQSDVILAWAVFAAVAISGIATAMQSARQGRLGSGHILLMGSSAVFVAICIDALARGGPALMATLVLAAGLFQMLLSERLSLFRRILTPTVSATVLMLTPVSVLQPIFQMLEDVPAGSPPFAAPVTAFITLAVICGLILLGTGGIRLWAPVIGVAAGAIAAAFAGLYDTSRISEAAWIGLPDNRWPGLNLEFGGVFWALFPGFLLAAMIGSIRTISSALAVQRVSWRTSRTVDYRAIQGAVTTDGLSNVLSGIVGTVPNTAYSLGASVAQLTGVASRRVGIAAGLATLVLALQPKSIALILAIPAPVFGAYLVVMMSILFMIGIRMLQQGSGLNHRRMVIVGISFWIGLGFQTRLIFPEFFADFAGGLLNNGMTSGGLTAILLTLVVKLSESRPRRLSMELDFAGLDQLREFLAEFARCSGWDQAMSQRLDAVSEEVLATLIQRQQNSQHGRRRRLIVKAKRSGGTAVLEFVSATGEGHNIQDQVALLADQVEEDRLDQELSIRLLRHLASFVHHQQYHQADIITVRVDAPRVSDG